MLNSNVSALLVLCAMGWGAVAASAAEDDVPARRGPGAISAAQIDKIIQGAESSPHPNRRNNAEFETVTIDIEEGVKLELTAWVVPAEKREHQPELCFFAGQLWLGAATCPPLRVMQSAVLTLHGEKILLDVNGLADPWIKPDEMTRRDVRFSKFEPEGGEPIYTLDIGFFKGGALDYMVTYEILHGAALRTKIEFMGDTRDWD